MKLGKSIKTMAAVMCSVSMILTSVPALAEDTSITAGGEGVVEFNNSSIPSYDNIVLPTTAEGTYDFTLDPQKLLHQYNPATYTDADATVLFNSEATSAKFTLVDDGTDTDAKLYTQSKSEVAVSVLKGKLTAAGGSLASITEKFYLWIPGTTETTKTTGEFLELTTANIEDYFDIACTDTTVDSCALKLDHLSGDKVCSEKIYQDAYTEVTIATEDATKHVKLNATGDGIDATETANNDINLYVNLNSGGYTQITKTNFATYLEIVPATSTYQGQSNKCTIVNKSTKAKTVTAKLTVKNASGLTFKDVATFTDDKKASVYLALNDGTNDKYVKDNAGTVTVTKKFSLAAPELDPVTYQSTDIDDKTGGHIYYQYPSPNISYTDCTFFIKASANSESDASDAWKEYNDTVTAATRPGVDVVYSISDAADYDLASDADNEVAATFKVLGDAVTKAAKGDVVTIVPGTVSSKVVDTVSFTPAEGSATAVTADANGVYSFTMPEKNVEVAVTYKDAFALTSDALNEAAATFKLGGIDTALAAKDDVVTIIPGTVDGKIVDTVKYTPAGGTATTVAETSGAYTFTMPDKAVTVAVTYKEGVAGPSIELTSAGVLTLKALTSAKNLASGSDNIKLGTAEASLYNLDNGAVTWDTSAWDSSTGGTIKITLKAAYTSAYAGQKVYVEAKMTDGSIIKGNATLN